MNLVSYSIQHSSNGMIIATSSTEQCISSSGCCYLLIPIVKNIVVLKGAKFQQLIYGTIANAVQMLVMAVWHYN